MPETFTPLSASTDSPRHPLSAQVAKLPLAAATPPAAAVLQLQVRNHPGTMSHVTGLFARRAFNLEAIACAPVGDGSTSVVLLLVANDPRLTQLEKQLEKLYDVLSLRHRADIGREFFARFADATPAEGPANR